MINTREIAAEYRLSHWARLMRERIESGLSIKDYCKHIGICGNTYFYWQRRVREAACQELIVTSKNENAIPNKPLVVNEPPRTEWIEIRDPSTENTRAKKILPIEINGCRVLAEPDIDSELLAKVCRVLISLC